MNSLFKKLAGLSLAGLATMSLAGPAEAVTLLGGGTVSRSVNAGTTSLSLSDSATSFCYLNRVLTTNADAVGETAECRVSISGTTSKYLVQAILGANGDAGVTCEARCYSL